MRAVVQRVTRASVRVGESTIAVIGPGLLVLLAVREGDGPNEAQWMARKIAGLRIFEGASGTFDRDLAAVDGEVLVVSQFTLYGDAAKGRRPSFSSAAPPDVAEPLYEDFVARMRSHGMTVATGQFAAMMAVELVNDGPVTLVIDRAPPGA